MHIDGSCGQTGAEAQKHFAPVGRLNPPASTVVPAFFRKLFQPYPLPAEASKARTQISDSHSNCPEPNTNYRLPNTGFRPYRTPSRLICSSYRAAITVTHITGQR